MSVYDGDDPQYVKECIESIQAQTLKDFELVLVDDGITREDLKRVLSEYANKDDQINLYHNEKNSGLAFSMNHAIEKAQGEFYARMDADDLMMPERLEKQLDFLQKHPEIDIVGSYYLEINEEEEVINKVTLPLEHKEMVKSFARRNPLAHVSVLMRKSFIEMSGPYPIVSSDQDTLMWANGIKNGAQLANIPEYLLKVRVSEDFFKRRGGFKKAYQDAKNRAYVIRSLNLSPFNYIYVALRFLFQLNPFPKLTYWGYKYLR